MEENKMTPAIFIKNIIDSFTWMVFLFITILTGIVFISQNSAPGEPTYAVKLGFEKALVRASKIIDNEITVQIELTKRRAVETQKVIASTHASESLNNLSQQVSTTEQTIATIQNPQKQQQAAVEFIKILSNTQSVLESEKQQLLTTEQNNPIQESSQNIAVTTSLQPTVANTFTVSTPTQTPQITPTPSVIPTEMVTVTTSNNVPSSTPLPTRESAKIPSPSPIPTSTLIPTQATVTTTANTIPPTLVSTQIKQTQQQIENTIDRLSKFETPHEKEQREIKKEEKKDGNKNDNIDKKENRKIKRD